jgi:hypothetical protein
VRSMAVLAVEDSDRSAWHPPPALTVAVKAAVSSSASARAGRSQSDHASFPAVAIVSCIGGVHQSALIVDTARRHIVALFVGAFLALAVGQFATGVGLDPERAFYPTVMVLASYSALLAVIGASMHTVALESLVGTAFLAAAATGFRSSLWVVVVALAAHGVFDLAHSHVITNPGVPGWSPAFCLTYDVMAAAYLGWLLLTGRVRAAT